MPDWDSEAVAYRRNLPTWHAWSERQWGILDPYSRMFWSRKQFRVALRSMPKDHPDRWRYEIGRRYAPSDSVLVPLSIVFSVFIPIASIPLSITSGIPWWIVAFGGVIGSWLTYAIRRRRALST